LTAADIAYLSMVELYTQASSVDEPRSHTEAMKSKQSNQWKAAEAEEITSLEGRGTWEAVPRPKNTNVVSCKWVYRAKYGANGEVTRYKARLVARGFTQVYGQDYQETFAPVTRLETLRLLLAYAVQEDWEVRQIDVKTAYLYGDLDEEIFMEAPEGYDIPAGHCLLLKKALYGLKQAGRQWYLKLKETMAEFGLTQVKSEPHTFVAHKVVRGTRYTLVLPVYVDDLFPIGNKILTDEFEKWIPKYFDITPPVDAHFFLGMRISRSRKPGFVKGISRAFIALDQVAFIESVLARVNVTLKAFKTPMTTAGYLEPNPNPVEDNDPAVVREYQSAIGSLMYIMLGTRPDLGYVVGRLSQFSANPSAKHMQAVARVLGYLSHEKEKCLVYYRQPANEFSSVPVGFCDADFGNDPAPEDKRRSVSGSIFFLSKGPISWSSRKQELTAESTMEAEYISLWSAGRQASWIRSMADAIGRPLPGPLKINCDSQSAIALATRGEVTHKGSKHFGVKFHATRDRVDRNEISIPYIPSCDNLADFLTKSLPVDSFVSSRDAYSVNLDLVLERRDS
jgi:hypothetical protein